MGKYTKLFLVAALIAAGGLLTLPLKASAAVKDWTKGITIQPRGNDDFSSANFKRSVDAAASDGVNNVALIVQLYQSNTGSTDVQAGWNTPTDQSLANAISYIKSKGMNATVNIHLDSYDGQWRAYINPGDKAGWFYNYGNWLNRYAVIAQNSGASQMVVGTELSSMTASQNTGSWNVLLTSVRQRFNGTLTYSAQHDGYMGETNLGFWSSLDYIGISAYYGLGSDDNVNSIKAQWDNVNNIYLSGLTARYGKPIEFTEIGYQSKDNMLYSPGDSYARGGGVNLQTQANAYQAMFQYWNDHANVVGAFIWDWSSDPNAGGSGNNDYTPQGKPAEQVMKQWYTTTQGGTSGGQGGGSTPPASQPSASNYSATITDPGQLTANTTASIKANVTANGTANNMTVDIEVYDASGNRVMQKFYEGQTLGTNASTYSFDWRPNASGAYKVSVGVFSSGWSSNPYWGSQIATLNVGQPATTPPSNPTPVTPPVTTPPTTPPTTTPPATTNPSSANISIWWPSNGSSINGVQPFKAVADNLASTQYQMFWQVDGGQLNGMGDSAQDAPHKEALVDVSTWRWNSNRLYTITFVAKNNAGATIATKSVTVSVY